MIKLNSLQSLRFIFALLIFISHYNITGNWGNYGVVGVSYFLILSGFVISCGYHDKVTSPDFNFRNFMIKRLSRLWPLHLLCLLFVVTTSTLIGHESFSLHKGIIFIVNAIMIQSWIPYKSVYFSFNPVSWFLTLIVFFYTVYPVIARKTQTLKREWIALISFGLIFLYIVLYSVIPGDWEHQFLYISPVFRLFDFMLGMALYEAYKFITVNLSEKVQLLSLTKKTMIEVAVVLLLFIMIIAGDNNIVKYGILLSSYFWLPMSCIILVFALFNKRGGNFKTLKQSDISILWKYKF